MKKLIVILMSVLLASFAFAGFDLGIKLGANYSYIESGESAIQDNIENFKSFDNINGFVGGIFTVIGGDRFGLQLEGLFSMEGFSIEQGGELADAIENTTIRTNYLNLVALARFNLPLRVLNPFVAIGVNGGIPLGEAEFDPELINIDNFDFKNLGLCAAVGFKVFDMVDVEVRYVKGLTDIYSLETDTSEPTFSNLVRLSLGLYIF